MTGNIKYNTDVKQSFRIKESHVELLVHIICYKFHHSGLHYITQNILYCIYKHCCSIANCSSDFWCHCNLLLSFNYLSWVENIFSSMIDIHG